VFNFSVPTDLFPQKYFTGIIMAEKYHALFFLFYPRPWPSGHRISAETSASFSFSSIDVLPSFFAVTRYREVNIVEKCHALFFLFYSRPPAPQAATCLHVAFRGLPLNRCRPADSAPAAAPRGLRSNPQPEAKLRA